tara:strand:+ start:76 stop:1002 length:927 start_codon:yes stop_codon:yes gene_type:complete
MKYDIEKAKTQSGSMTTTPTKLAPSELITGLPSNVTPQSDRQRQEQMKAQEDLRANMTDRLKGVTAKIKSKQLEIDNEQKGKNNSLKLNRLNQEMTTLRSEAGKIKQQAIADSGIKARQTKNLAGQLTNNVKEILKPQQPPKPIPQPTALNQKQRAAMEMFNQVQANKRARQSLPKPIQRPPQQKPPQTQQKPDKRTQFRDVMNTTSLSTTPDMTPKKTIRTRKAKRLPTGDIAYGKGTPPKVRRIPQGSIKPDKQPKQMSRRVKEILQRGKEQGGIALRNPNEPRTTRIRRKNPNEPRTGRIRRRTQ